MHILVMPSERFVTEDFPFGGIFQRDQALGLHRAGVRVGVVAAAPRGWNALRKRITGWPSGIEVTADEGIPVYRYQQWSPVRGHVRFVSQWLWARSAGVLFARYVREQGRPDLIHAHNALFAGYVAVQLGSGRIPVLLTEHSSPVALGRTRRWEEECVARALQSSRIRIFVSSALGRMIQRRYGEAACPWEVVPNMLDRMFEETTVSANEFRQSGRLRVLNVAALTPGKNQGLLLQAFAQAFSGMPGVELRIAGDGPLRKSLQQDARRLGIPDRVFFLGALGRPQVLQEMRACDMFVLSSDYETFGVVLIEALACGKPVLSTRCGGPEDIVHCGNGVLVPPGDPEALAKGMRDIHARIASFSPGLLRSDCLERYSARAVASRLMRIYAQVLDSASN